MHVICKYVFLFQINSIVNGAYIENEKDTSEIFQSMLGELVWSKSNDGDIFNVSTAPIVAKSKIVGVYMSASWCRPCREFTPNLVKFYERMAKKNKNFEIFLISKDRDVESFEKYFKSMPWFAVHDTQIHDAEVKLSRFCPLDGIPKLIIFDESGQLISCEGVTLVYNDMYGVEFPWKAITLMSIIPKPLVSYANMKLNAIRSTAVSLVTRVSNQLTPLRILRNIFKSLLWIAISSFHSIAKITNGITRILERISLSMDMKNESHIESFDI